MVAHQGEAETGAAHVAAVVGGPPTEKPLEDCFTLLGRYSRSRVIHVHGELPSLVVESNGRRAPGVVVGVVDEVGDHAFEAPSVHRYQWIVDGGGHFNGGLDDAVTSSRGTHGLTHEFDGVDRLDRQGHRAGVGARHL